jgi:hypothetical protein
VIAAVLVLLPLLALRAEPIGGGHRAALVAYFGGLGFGYMLLEIALITCCTLWVGDAVLAGALVLGAFLVCSGIGSATLSPWLRGPSMPRRLSATVVGIVVLAFLWWQGGFSVFHAIAGAPALGRALIAAVGLAPLAFLMGGPFPAGLSQVERSASGWLPWAWAINGFASVTGAILAAVIAMAVGFRWVIAAGVACYVVAWLASLGLPRGQNAVVAGPAGGYATCCSATRTEPEG